MQLTTGTSKSYLSFQDLCSGLTISISEKAKGRFSQTSASTWRALVHRPQFSLVKNVTRQDWSSLVVARIFRGEGGKS